MVYIYGNPEGNPLEIQRIIKLNLELAYEIKANIIIKGGPNAKWYLKYFPKDQIQIKINKQKWRDTNRATMWVIEWDIEP